MHYRESVLVIINNLYTCRAWTENILALLFPHLAMMDERSDACQAMQMRLRTLSIILFFPKETDDIYA
jgi:hypothetical protein